MQRFAREIARALDDMIGSGVIGVRDIQCSILTPPGADTTFRLNHIEIRQVGLSRGQLWEQFELPWHARGGVLFSPCTVGPVMKRKHVVAIHDAIHLDMPENFTPLFRRWYGILLPVLVKQAERIVTVSEYSKDRLVRRLGIHPSRIALVSEGAEHILRTPPDHDILRRLDVRPGRFILAVGSRKPVKNFEAVRAAWSLLEDLDLDLVVAGSSNPRLFGKTRLEAQKRMHLIGRANDAELRALYENALSLALPSFMEGFGLPIVEAMASGCPVVTSPNGAIPEVAGDAALYCDARQPEELAAQIRSLAIDSELRESLRRAGLERVRRFTWTQSAQAVLEATGFAQRNGFLV